MDENLWDGRRALERVLRKKEHIGSDFVLLSVIAGSLIEATTAKMLNCEIEAKARQRLKQRNAYLALETALQ